MSQELLPELSKKQNASFHGHSLTNASSDLNPVLRSYTEIRKQMHLSLQARLNRDYLRKMSAIPVKTEASIRENRKLWETIRKTAMSTALSHIKIDAKLKTLAARVKTEIPTRVQLLSSSAESLEIKKLIRQVAFLPQYPAITIKEAMKDREWLSKNKESLLRGIATIVNESNGVRIVVPDTGETYKYYIRKGNNSSLIHQIMKTRPWWTRVKAKADAHFVWSVKREQAYFALIPSGSGKMGARIEGGKVTLSCTTKFCPGDSKVARGVNMKPLGYGAITGSPSYVRVITGSVFDPRSLRVHNRLENNTQLTHKKTLYRNLKLYYDALGEDYTQSLPLTFHITMGEHDPEFAAFLRCFQAREAEIAGEEAESGLRNLWIIKPGENSNQGRDIVVCSSIDQIRTKVRLPIDRKTGQMRTFIIQKYIDRPFLYNKRKFDIRCYALVTAINGVVQGYFYPEGYLRTSSKEFSLKHVGDKYIHLTNDAVQKNSEEYGKFEYGNKISYSDFQKYLEAHFPDLNISFLDQVLPQIKHLVQDSLKATFFKLDPHRRSHTFEILGYDIMLDWRLKPVLIEVNTNPCLALVSPLLFRVIPGMVDGALRLVLDSLFPDCTWNRKTHEPLQENRWELIFHELVDGRALQHLLQSRGTFHLLEAVDEIGWADDRSEDSDSAGVG